MTDLRTQLQLSLGTAYALERELGGGGMSRVFVAEETAFGRKVVVKVLPPELAAGVSVDRFKREIQLAARLQHPHIVPVLAAGEAEGLPFYTMPLVDGSSLRGRLAAGGMSIGEAVGILREVARALAYAHAQGVVHRDIKPDNVLLTAGGSAVVTDFGIAKALSAAREAGSATITQVGTSIGTPTYMAPEQATGDPNTDHRADVYAFGVMAYEMLAGRPPFHGLPQHRLLAAHLGEAPVPLAERRPDVPPVLAGLVMQCLAKDPDARPQSAADVARFLETVTSGTGEPALAPALLAGRVTLGRALALYAAACVAVAVLARAAIVGIGLPSWVFPGALAVMALGLPVILFTAFVHHHTRRALTTTPVRTPGGTPSAQGTLATIAIRASPHVNWRRTTTGGVAALSAFVLLVGGWMAARAMGIGPAGSLMATGAMGERERVVVADFEGPPNDSLLGPTVTEAFRTDLASSSNLSLMPETGVREVLRRMQRPPTTPVDFAVAREIATREGMKAVIDGKVVAIGGRYVLSARLVSAQTGEELAVVSATADDETEIIPAIGRLSRALRERVGESLQAIQRAPAVERVTTASLAALQRYVAATRVLQREGDLQRGRQLLEEAIALDTTFAMAYRRLGVELTNRGLAIPEAQAALQKAYDHRDRLSDGERHLTVATYFSAGPAPDEAKSIAALEALLALQPDNMTALNNLANGYFLGQEYAKAEEMARRARELEPWVASPHANYIYSLTAQGKLDEAERAAAYMAQQLPRNPASGMSMSEVRNARGDRDGALAILDSLMRERASDLGTVQQAGARMAAIEMARGRLQRALSVGARAREAEAKAGNGDAGLSAALDEVEAAAWFLGDRERGRAILQRALAARPLDSIEPAYGPWERLAFAHAALDQPEGTRAVLAAYEESRRRGIGGSFDGWSRPMLRGYVALAERRYAAAAEQFRLAIPHDPCGTCTFAELGRAYDLAGNADSAIAVFTRYVESPSDLQRTLYVDRLMLAGAHRRLAELHDARGDRAAAASYYARFVELWKDADPELRPLVHQARERLAELQRGAER